MAAFYNCRCWLQRPTTPSKASRFPRLRVSTAHDEWNHDVQALVAMEKGYFREEGLEEVELVAFHDDEESQLEAIHSGWVDLGMDPLTNRVLRAQDHGADIYVVAPRRKMHSFVFFGQKWMKGVTDLKGKTVNLLQDGEASHQLRQVLKMHGLELGKDVKITPRTTQMHDLLGMRKSFIQGEDLIVPVHPWESDQWQQMGYPILVDTPKLFPPRQDRVVVVNGRFLRERRESLKAFLKAYIRASQFIVTKSNSEEIWEILEKAGFLANDVDRENYDKVMEGQWYRLSPDGSFPLDGVEQVIKEQKEAGKISDAITLDRVLQLEPLYDAQKELGIRPA